MSNKIGRFEILSELAHSDTASIYKATDSESGKTVALKTLKLEALGDQAQNLVQSLLQEVEGSKALNSPNIAPVYDAAEVDGVFCASLEYVQGNSIATMLARKEGFSIWDLMDIARQTCQGLDHAHAKKVVHYTLEPSKIMVTWDGTVKILGFGISTMSALASQAAGKAPEVLHYMSPEQLRGDPLDAHSNLFSLGAILYEMVTERKAFDGDDADQVRQAILERMPVAADQVNRKIHPALSQVIMKALAKSPEERYSSGQELVNDLERCKESATKTSAPAKPSPVQQKASTPAKTVTPAAKPAVSAPAVSAFTARTEPKLVDKPAPVATKAAAAAAGASSSASSEKLGGFELETRESGANPPAASASAPAELMSHLTTEETEIQAPKIAVDPMMDESRPTGGGGRSFSEIDELPPLKEVYIPAPPPPPVEQEHASPTHLHAAVTRKIEPDKPKIQPKEVARKAVTEIKKTPPQLFVYSIAAAALIILLIITGIAYRIHSQNADDDGPPPAAQEPATDTAATAQPAPQPTPATGAAQDVTPPQAEEPAAVSIQPKYNAKKKTKTKPVAAPAVVPGILSINSSPAGAQVQVDGQSNPVWQTPYDIGGLNPGQHTLTITKSGYASDTRTIDVASGSKSFVTVQLSALTATLSVTSDPSAAEVWMDGKNTGRVTPAQIAVDKPGNHSFTFKKQGYLDETASANLQIGQISHLSPSLKSLGNTDDIKLGGKFKKLFNGGDTAGMGAVSVKTQPKGAQVAVNNRILDKMAPVDFYLDPGNYVIDITLSGFKPIHKVIVVERSGKVVIDENMDRQ
jgi:serine/threonine protein kinase